MMLKPLITILFAFSKKIPKKQYLPIIYNNNSIEQFIKQAPFLSLKNFSVKVHHLLVKNVKDEVFWRNVQTQFINRIDITTDPQQIRSFSKLFYSLSKAKQTTLNYQSKFGILLPFATHQSFTMITVAASRVGPLSHQFLHIVEKLYYKRIQQFNVRERVQINYVLTRHGVPVDKNLIYLQDKMNCVQVLTMLRCYDYSQQITEEILKICSRGIYARKNEINVLDMKDIIKIYFKYNYITPQMQQFLTQIYGYLKRSVDEVIFYEIWEYFPQMVNMNKLKITFINEIIKTLTILRKHDKFREHIWRDIKKKFKSFENLQIRVKLQQIK